KKLESRKSSALPQNSSWPSSNKLPHKRSKMPHLQPNSFKIKLSLQPKALPLQPQRFSLNNRLYPLQPSQSFPLSSEISQSVNNLVLTRMYNSQDEKHSADSGIRWVPAFGYWRHSR